jgi:hypothetical protein
MGRWDVTPLPFRLQIFEKGKGTATIHLQDSVGYPYPNLIARLVGRPNLLQFSHQYQIMTRLIWLTIWYNMSEHVIVN